MRFLTHQLAGLVRPSPHLLPPDPSDPLLLVSWVSPFTLLLCPPCTYAYLGCVGALGGMGAVGGVRMGVGGCVHVSGKIHIQFRNRRGHSAQRGSGAHVILLPLTISTWAEIWFETYDFNMGRNLV